MRPDKVDRDRASRLGRQFALTVAEYEEILEHQGGCCAVCGRPPCNVRLAVDHSHRTGEVRGLLDYSCNHALGVFRDREDLLLAAAKYLQHPPAEEALGGKRWGLRGRVGNKVATIKKLNSGVTDARKLPANQKKGG